MKSRLKRYRKHSSVKMTRENVSYLELKRWAQDGKAFVEYQIYLEGMPVCKVIHEAKETVERQDD